MRKADVRLYHHVFMLRSKIIEKSMYVYVKYFQIMATLNANTESIQLENLWEATSKSKEEKAKSETTLASAVEKTWF